LSAAARQGFEAGEQITIKASNAQELGELHRRTTVPARVDKALRYLASKGRPGTPIWINIDLDFPAVGAEDKDEFGGLTVDQIRIEVVLVFGTQKGAFLR
jgi:hypothetical protein